MKKARGNDKEGLKFMVQGDLGSGNVVLKPREGEKPEEKVPSLKTTIRSTNFKVKKHMAGVQNSWSKGLYKVGPIGIEKLILHLRYEAGPIGNDAVHKLGASIVLAWR